MASIIAAVLPEATAAAESCKGASELYSIFGLGGWDGLDFKENKAKLAIPVS